MFEELQRSKVVSIFDPTVGIMTYLVLQPGAGRESERLESARAEGSSAEERAEVFPVMLENI